MRGVAPEVCRHADAAALCATVADEIGALVRSAGDAVSASPAAAGAGCVIALAGGRTPRAVYERLAADRTIDWSQVVLVFGDERAVPPDDDASNYRMVAEALLERLPGPTPRVHRIAGELGADEAARRYRTVIDEIGRFDLVLLGMGDDGHVASIFPGSPEPDDDASVIATMSPLPPPARVSLTLATLGRARAVSMLVTGLGKARRLAEVREQILRGDAVLPAARLARHLSPDTRFRWHVDAAAASELTTAEEGT